ncbi:hypothetical protein QR680_003031 [Steinernema hermaphroditum]|uniref:Uncharacterized protein n=1 Tax=Steinernema hermaphroditum TaxID=289476 RepID=A0AA39LJD9_9BILA|nr:hypothetical protein QR680_003031 [Steinernema hermaphroditum]
MNIRSKMNEYNGVASNANAREGWRDQIGIILEKFRGQLLRLDRCLRNANLKVLADEENATGCCVEITDFVDKAGPIVKEARESTSQFKTLLDIVFVSSLRIDHALQERLLHHTDVIIAQAASFFDKISEYRNRRMEICSEFNIFLEVNHRALIDFDQNQLGITRMSAVTISSSLQFLCMSMEASLNDSA